MRRSQRKRLTVEALESRCLLSVSIAPTPTGYLNLSGSTTSGLLEVVQTGPSTFDWRDGVGPFATATGITQGVNVKLTGVGDDVSVDLGGFSTNAVSIETNGGDNAIKVFNGTIAGNLSLKEGVGNDSVTLGDGTAAGALIVSSGVYSTGGDPGNDSFTLTAGSEARRGIYVTGTENVLIEGVVGYGITDVGGSGDSLVAPYTGNLLKFAAGSTVTGSVAFYGTSNTLKTDGLVVEPGATITSWLAAKLDNTASSTGGADVVDLGGTIEGAVTLWLGGGADTVTAGGTLKKNFTVYAEAGNDTVNLGTVAPLTIAGGAYVYGGANGDNDALTLAAGSSVQWGIYVTGTENVTIDGVVGYGITDVGGNGNSTVAPYTGNLLTINGTVNGNISFHGTSAINKTDGVIVSRAGRITGWLSTKFDGDSTLLGGNDIATIEGRIEGSATLRMGAGNDTVNINGGKIGSSATSWNLLLYAGDGHDIVTIAGAAALNGFSAIWMGAGDDTFDITAYTGAVMQLWADGEAGNDTFNGVSNNAKIASFLSRVRNFEVLIG